MSDDPALSAPLDDAMEALLRSMETFIDTWASALRHLGHEPEALLCLREAREAIAGEPRKAADFDVLSLATPVDRAHPLWDREIDP